MKYFLVPLFFPLLASAQPIRPLRPLVVLLDSGTVTSRPLVGLDPAAYQAVRAGQDNDQQLLLVRAARINGLLAARRADSLFIARQALELRASRLDVAGLSGELTKSEVRNRKLLAMPLQKPFLLDKNTWLGALVGAVGAGVLVLSR